MRGQRLSVEADSVEGGKSNCACAEEENDRQRRMDEESVETCETDAENAAAREMGDADEQRDDSMASKVAEYA